MKQLTKRGLKLKKALIKTTNFPGQLDLMKLKYLFNSYKNPIYIWEAYACCRKWEIDIPCWVFEYFDRCSENLINIKPSNRTRKQGFDSPWGYQFSST
jgi:hypothetical protein